MGIRVVDGVLLFPGFYPRVFFSCFFGSLLVVTLLKHEGPGWFVWVLRVGDGVIFFSFLPTCWFVISCSSHYLWPVLFSFIFFWQRVSLAVFFLP